ncbi:MAG: 2-oxoglutarate dehydrogenase complex dihydrolipoyllysine-residue succinyltransferase [Candidatus Aminicenantes bacterium]|jgi:2-oxoglutarate dehydrogenase E2 component (dihydrolipoamide succinyltransferase)
MIFEVRVPMVGESITEVVMGEWKKSDGDYVEVDEPICVIESEKAAMDIVAEKAGQLRVKAKTGDTLNIGDLIAEIDTSVREGKSRPEAEKDKEAQEVPVEAEHEKIFITPVAKKMLEEAGIAAEAVKGSGPAGRITKADALQAIEAEKNKDKEVHVEEKKVEKIDFDREGKETREPMSTLRRTIARHLVAAKNETAMLTTMNEIDMSAILELREELKEEFLDKFGVKLGFMSLFGRAVCIALKEMPVVNARIEGDDIVYHHYVDLSIAVSTPRGLVVPVIRHADQLSMEELENQIQELAVKARDGKLSIQDMSGGTFTITNGGVFGSLLSTPIINAPQSAVLGMHTIQERPIAINDQVVIRPMMYVALSYDHRIIDGRESVLFLVHVKKLLENPNRMLLEL